MPQQWQRQDSRIAEVTRTSLWKAKSAMVQHLNKILKYFEFVTS